MENLFKLDNKNVGSESLIKQAEQIWAMLDDMADHDVDSYRFFYFMTLCYAENKAFVFWERGIN